MPDPGLPFWGGQFFVGDCALFYPLPGGVDYARARCQPYPMSFAIAVGGGYICVDPLGRYGLGDAFGFGARQPANIDSQENISGAPLILPNHSLNKTFLGEDHVDFNTGFFSKAIKERSDQIRLAIGIDIYLLTGAGGVYDTGDEYACRYGDSRKVLKQTDYHHGLLIHD